MGLFVRTERASNWSEVEKYTIFTQRPLPPQMTPVPVIGLTAPMGHGKDAVADRLVAWLLATKSTWPCRLQLARVLRQCVEILTGGEIPASRTQTTEQKSVVLRSGWLGSDENQMRERVKRALWHAQGCPAKQDDAPHVRVECEKTTDLAPHKVVPVTRAMIDVALECLAREGAHRGTMTVGRLLQVFGTQIGRALLGDTVWIDAVRRTIDRVDRERVGSPIADRLDATDTPMVDGGGQTVAIVAIVTDVRFRNEVDFIKSYGSRSLLFRIDSSSRLNPSLAAQGQVLTTDGRERLHASETSLDGLPPETYTAVIDNNGTLADLDRILQNEIFPRITSAILSMEHLAAVRAL